MRALSRTTLLGLMLCATIAQASETITYTYDTRGRLKNAAVAGGPAAGVSTAITHDRADNRSRYQVTAAGPVTVADFGFETPAVGSGYTYNPTVTGTTFAGSSGVTGNGSAFGFANAPEGTQVGFLQSGPSNSGTITLNVSGLTTSQNYVVRYYHTQRPGFGTNPVTVSFGGASLGTFTPGTTSFAQVASASFTASAATGQVVFSTGTRATDSATAIDLVTIEVAP